MVSSGVMRMGAMSRMACVLCASYVYLVKVIPNVGKSYERSAKYGGNLIKFVWLKKASRRPRFTGTRVQSRGGSRFR